MFCGLFHLYQNDPVVGHQLEMGRRIEDNLVSATVSESDGVLFQQSLLTHAERDTALLQTLRLAESEFGATFGEKLLVDPH